jgi:hypothetical protein
MTRKGEALGCTVEGHPVVLPLIKQGVVEHRAEEAELIRNMSAVMRHVEAVLNVSHGSTVHYWRGESPEAILRETLDTLKGFSQQVSRAQEQAKEFGLQSKHVQGQFRRLAMMQAVDPVAVARAATEAFARMDGSMPVVDIDEFETTLDDEDEGLHFDKQQYRRSGDPQLRAAAMVLSQAIRSLHSLHVRATGMPASPQQQNQPSPQQLSAAPKVRFVHEGSGGWRMEVDESDSRHLVPDDAKPHAGSFVLMQADASGQATSSLTGDAGHFLRVATTTAAHVFHSGQAKITHAQLASTRERLKEEHRAAHQDYADSMAALAEPFQNEYRQPYGDE